MRVKQLEDQIALEDDLAKAAMPMDWGIEALVPSSLHQGLSPREQLLRYAAEHRTQSDVFYRPQATDEYVLSGKQLYFPSAIETETPENNVVHCRVFETRKKSKAVILLPHWNAESGRYSPLASLLRSRGIATLQITLPYNEQRRPTHMKGADYLLSANLGRTIRSIRQAVLDCRLAIDWLNRRGYDKIGLLGCSLGSAIGFVLMAHEPRITAGALLLMGSDFGETVWMSCATQHIQQAVRKELTLGDLKQIWSVISPTTYASKLQRSTPLLVVSGRHDRVCPPHLTREGIEIMQRTGLDYTWKIWSCGHYTLGTFPYKLYLAGTLLRFFGRTLSRGPQ